MCLSEFERGRQNYLSRPILFYMSNTARDYKTDHSVATDGLDDLFEATVITDQSECDNSAQLENTQPEFDHGHWTIAEASKHLQVSAITVRRRLQRGELEGSKIQGPNGPEWRIKPCNLDPDQTLLNNSDLTPEHDHTQVDNPAQPELTQPLINDKSDPSQMVIDSLLKRISDLEHSLADSQSNLQSASWRNGYLESRIQTQEDQIKLLTDSQHKPSKWARFKAWFFGQ